jgi:hypothetical protein
MTRPVLKVTRMFSLGLAAWVAWIGLLDFAPELLLHAQTAKPSATAWKFRLEETKIEDIHRAIRSGQITCARLVQAYINRIRAYDGSASRRRTLMTATIRRTISPMSPSTRELRCNSA